MRTGPGWLMGWERTWPMRVTRCARTIQYAPWCSRQIARLGHTLRTGHAKSIAQGSHEAVTNTQLQIQGRGQATLFPEHEMRNEILLE
mgnify:CR=1 FL=1